MLTIDPSQRGQLEAKLAKLNRRALRLALPPVSATFAERLERIDAVRSRVVLDVTLTGDRPVLAGWELLGRVEHTEAGNLISKPPGSVEDLDSYYDAKPTCDHCGLSRNRRDTFVLRHVATNRVKRVGRSCLVDFLGTDNAESAAMASLWGDFYPENPEGEGSAFYSPQFSVQTVIAFAIASIRVDGAYRKERGTSDAVHRSLGSPPRRGFRQSDQSWEREQDDYRARQATEADAQHAVEVLQWGIAQHDGDYLHNVGVACATTITTDRTFGVLCSVPAAHAKAMGYQATNRTGSLPKISPDPGRQVVTGTVRTKKLVESDFGQTLKMLLVVVTEAGTWNGWATVPAKLTCSEGDTVTIKATVEPKEPGFAILKRAAVVA